jgi:RNA polymerase sigma factor (sigma-70 family)
MTLQKLTFLNNPPPCGDLSVGDENDTIWLKGNIMAADSESVLIRRFSADGDAGAFSEIVRRHARMVYGVCVRILEDESDAADATQETFYQLVQQAREISGSVASWLHTVATRKSIDLIRRGKARRRRERSYASGKTGQVETWHDLSGHVDHILQELDEDVRSVLLEHFFEGKTTTQIAKDRGISQATASRRVNQGLDLLRDGLKKRGLLATGVILSSLLGQGASYAVPAAVTSELTKMAMVGSSVAGGIAATGGATGAKAAAGGMMAGLSGKVTAAVAVAAIGVGSVVTYDHFTQDSGPPAAVSENSSFESRSRSPSKQQRVRSAPPVTVVGDEEQSHKQGAVPDQDAHTGETSARTPDESLPAPIPGEADRPEITGFAMGSFGMGMGATPPDENLSEEEANSPPEFLGGGLGGAIVPRRIDPNELLEELSSEDQ